MTDEELDALENNLAVRGKQDREMSNHYVHRMEVDRVAAKSAITALRAQLAEARAERDGLLRAVTDNHIANTRADRAEAALAAQIEADAEICTYVIKNYDCMKADKETYQPMWVQKVAKGMVSLARQDIRNQPHDRTALDRYREKVLREAAAVELQYFDEDGNMSMRKLPFHIKNTILALIEKPNAR